MTPVSKAIVLHGILAIAFSILISPVSMRATIKPRAITDNCEPSSCHFVPKNPARNCEFPMKRPQAKPNSAIKVTFCELFKEVILTVVLDLI